MWNDLRRKVSKQEMIQHYGDMKMPMQLRMLAEAVTGVGLVGQDGTRMRKQMVETEKEGPSGGHVTTMFSFG